MAENPQFVKLTGFTFLKANKQYTGSYRGLQYSVEIAEGEDGPQIEAAVWPAPYCRAQTDPAIIETARFALDEDGMHAAERWVEAQYYADKERWKAAAAVSVLDVLPWQPPKEPPAE